MYNNFLEEEEEEKEKKEERIGEIYKHETVRYIYTKSTIHHSESHTVPSEKRPHPCTTRHNVIG